jgi:hypothetical protein
MRDRPAMHDATGSRPPGHLATMAAAAIVAWMVTTACATSQQPGRKSSATIDSHRNGSFDGRVTRLLVLLARSDHPDEDQLFRAFIEQELQKRHVAAVVTTVSDTTVNAPEPLASAELADKRRPLRSLGPEAVMRIKTASVIADAARPQWRTKITYDIRLFLMSSDVAGQHVWRAELAHSGPERAMEKRLSLAATCLMERLDTERILASDADGP